MMPWAPVSVRIQGISMGPAVADANAGKSISPADTAALQTHPSLPGPPGGFQMPK